MVSVITYLSGLIVVTWFGLKAFDAARAWRYNRARQRRDRLTIAFWAGYDSAVGDYAPILKQRSFSERMSLRWKEESEEEINGMLAEIYEMEQ